MKILLSWSSGKDSAWALHVLNQTDPGSVAALLTTFNERVDRVAMHGVRHDVVDAQAEAVGLPLRVVTIPEPCSNAVYQARMREACDTAIADGFTHVAFGDLFLEDVRRYREDQLAGTGLAPLFPLWGVPTDTLAATMIESGMQATLTCVDTRVIGASFAGRAFDRALLTELPPGVDRCGERGEFHSCVTAGPMFRHTLDTEIGEMVTREPFVWRELRLRRTAGAPGPALPRA